MLTERGPVIVTSGECPFLPGIHEACVRHRTFPTLYGEGATDREAAKDLVRKLNCETSSVVDWHLTDLERAIADIQAYVDPSAYPAFSLKPSS